MKATVERMAVRMPAGRAASRWGGNEGSGSGGESSSFGSGGHHDRGSTQGSGATSSRREGDGTIVIALCDVTVGHRRQFLKDLNPSQREEVCGRPAAADQ